MSGPVEIRDLDTLPLYYEYVIDENGTCTPPLPTLPKGGEKISVRCAASAVALAAFVAWCKSVSHISPQVQTHFFIEAASEVEASNTIHVIEGYSDKLHGKVVRYQ